MFEWDLNTKASNVNDKDIRTMSHILMPLLLTLNIFHKLIFMLSFYILHINSCFHSFEQVNAVWKVFKNRNN